MMKRIPYVGSDFDDFLKEEKIFDEAQAVVVKRVLSFQLEQSMKQSKLTKKRDSQTHGNDQSATGSFALPGKPGNDTDDGHKSSGRTWQSRKDTDNAFIESFFHSMKSEVFHGYIFTEDQQVRQTLRSYLPFYNRDRLHSSLNYVSPATYEKLHA